MNRKLIKRSITALLMIAMVFGIVGCGNTKSAETEATPADKDKVATEAPAATEVSVEETEIQVFVAASLNTVMTEIARVYNEINPQVKITFNADSSGTLLTQIQEGYECDIFFSAAQRQMDTLEEDGLVVEGTRANVLNNQVVVIALNDSETTVTGLESLKEAESIALAGGSVPVGRYTRQALVNLGILEEVEDVSKIETSTISEALGGVEISEQDNVSKVLTAVSEGSCEVGTVYYSDTYGFEDKIKILETVSYDLTGNVIYPICEVVNDEADDAQKAAAADFRNFILSDEVKAILETYYFDTNVER